MAKKDHLEEIDQQAFTISINHSFIQQILSYSYVPNTILDTRDMIAN